MKKRILCAIMTLIMLVSLVPAAALGASAASRAASEAAITVLKQMESYSTACDGKTFGYGTACTAKDKDAAHTHNETEADTALRAFLKELDTAINSFADKNGLGLTQGQHDALVLFCFDNGTAWLSGTGDLQTAIVNKATGSEFLGAICRWSNADNNNRRMVEANMYLNGAYKAEKPSSFIAVTYDAKNNTDVRVEYYDTASNPTADYVPTRTGYTFLGWYNSKDAHVTNLTSGGTLTAKWQKKNAEAGSVTVNTTVKLASAVSLYNTPSSKASAWSVKGTIKLDSEYIDKNGTRWGRVASAGFLYEDGEQIGKNVDLTDSADWIKLTGNSSAAANAAGGNMDVTVTVTNSYLRVREEASIYSAELRQVHQGDKLRIVKTTNGSDGFLWGKIENNQGWVALMYTDYNSVKEQTTVNTATGSAIATAVVNVNGYVNVRSDAGITNQIVGALANGTEVELYETKFVNGIQWGRCNSGWFCLSYATVNNLANNNAHLNDAGFASYAFAGKLNGKVYTTAGGTKTVKLAEDFNYKKIVISNLVDVNGDVWGKIAEGWVNVTADVELAKATFTVSAAEVAVRENPGTDSTRIDTLVKGVEINVYQLAIANDTIWGYADKYKDDYSGWVNLSTKNVTRTNAPTVQASNGNAASGYTGTIATIVGSDKVNVRVDADIYSTAVGKISHGTQAPVLDQKNGWYKIDFDVDGNPETASWVYKDYVKISEGTISSGTTGNAGTNGTTGSTAAETGMGIIANTYSGVNIRTAPGVGNAALGKILPGTTVEILEVTTYGAAKWGRVEEGWICMDYVTMLTDFLPGTTPGTDSSTTSQTAIYEGIAVGEVEVYKTTSLDSEVVRTLSDGETVTVHELLTVVENENTTTENEDEGETITTVKTTKYWARVNDGYIYAPGEGNIKLETLDEVTYTITADITVGGVKLAKNTKVTVTELKIVNGGVEGYVENTTGGIGWVSMSKMVKGAVNVTESKPENNTTTPAPSTPVIGAGSSTGGVTNTDGYRYTGKVINTTSLNVRSTPSTTATKTTTLAGGDSLVIYETTTSENMAWGRCDAGWVYLYYVDLTPVVNGAVDARVVYNENTVAYTDMNGTEVAGTYAKMSVIDIYEVVGKMARTELGWVHTDNLLK